MRRYLAAKTRVDKGSVIRSIVDEVRGASPHQGRFIRLDHRFGLWIEVGDATAREKVGATIRSIIRKAGGEDTLLPLLSCLDNREVPDDSPSSAGEPLILLKPPIVAPNAPKQPREEKSSSLNVASSITKGAEEELNKSAWSKTTGLDDSPSSAGESSLVDWKAPSFPSSLKGSKVEKTLLVDSKVNNDHAGDEAGHWVENSRA